MSTPLSLFPKTVISCLQKPRYKMVFLEIQSNTIGLLVSLTLCLIVSSGVYFLWRWFGLADLPAADFGGHIAKPSGWCKFSVLVLPIICFVPSFFLILCQILSPRSNEIWKRTFQRDIRVNCIISLVWSTLPFFWYFNSASAPYIGFLFLIWLILKCFVMLPWMLAVSRWNFNNGICLVLIVWSLSGGIAMWSAQMSTYSDAVKYMLFTHSLVKHGTEDVSQTVENREFREFYWGRWHKDFIHVSPGSIHAPLTPYALYLPYALGGRLGILIFYSLLLSLTAALTVGFIQNFKIFEVKPAIVASLVGTTSCPVIFLSHVEFPDTIGLFLFALSLYIASLNNLKSLSKIGIISCFTVLVFYIKHRLVIGFIGIIFALGFDYIIHLFKLKKERLLVGILTFCCILMAIYTPIYLKGLWKDYNAFSIIETSLKGLFGGQNFGLFVVAPVFMLAFISLYESYRINKSFFIICFFSIFTSLSLLIGLNWFAWHGGFSPPYRYLMYTLPAWTALLPFWLATKNTWRKILFWLLTCIGALYTIVGLVFPFLKTNRPIGPNRLFVFLEQITNIPFHTFLPSVFMRTGHIDTWFLFWLVLSFMCVIGIELSKDNNYLNNTTRILYKPLTVILLTLISATLFFVAFSTDEKKPLFFEAEVMNSHNTSVWSPTNPLHMRGRVFFNDSDSEIKISIPADGIYDIGLHYIAQMDGTINIYLDGILTLSLPVIGTATASTRKEHTKHSLYGLTRGRFKDRETSVSKLARVTAGDHSMKVEYKGPDGKENWVLIDYLFFTYYCCPK
jgi:hypothetical protein